MLLYLNDEQQEQLELISMYAGKLPVQVLMDAAMFLLETGPRRDEPLNGLDLAEGCRPFLDDGEMNARFAEVLRR